MLPNAYDVGSPSSVGKVTDTHADLPVPDLDELATALGAKCAQSVARSLAPNEEPPLPA